MDSESKVVDWLARLRQGDLPVLADLFQHYRDRLWRMVHFRIDPRLATRVDADDVLQEAWIAAQQRVQHWIAAPEKSFFIWLRLGVGQVIIDVHRRHLGAQRRDARLEVPMHSGASVSATSMSLAGHLMASLTTPSQAAMKAEVSRRLEDALASMDEIDREVLMLRHFEELSNNEVAEVLGMKESATSNRYVRALTRLRSILEETPGFPGPETRNGGLFG
ncbi:MAG: sigma-70 family RNA polymerase sigma factor [Salinibacterium sp.]|nr:sigma-70 family RNA polymerase sigma factor [Salinibacterium sp.]